MNLKNETLIYVVEDNKIYNHFICENLRKLNYRNVKSFLSGKECIKRVAGGESPNVVIQDYFLNDMKGTEVMLAVKKHSKKSEFIFLTVNVSLEEAVQSVKLGAFDYILKEKDATLKKVVDNIEEIVMFQHKQKKTKVIRIAMIASVFVLIDIVIFGILHFFYDAFGLM
jgi:DNA-binding NtrC family response regulator